MTYIIAALAIVGTVLNVRGRRARVTVWSVTNAYRLAHNALIGEWAQAGIYAVNLGLAVWGLIRWGRIRRKNKNESN